MPQNRTACLQCQRHKVKCDSSRPRCSRCSRLQKECSYPSPRAKNHWPTATSALEARVLEAEITIHKLTLSSTHDICLVSKKLLEKIEGLGDLSRPRKSLYVADSFRLLAALDSANSEAQQQVKRVPLLQDVLADDPESVQTVIKQGLLLHDLTKLEQLPLSLSIQLISLFFPYRTHYFFQIDGDQFMGRISLPPSHPNSIHPCLLNACYLGACASNGGVLAEFKPYFVHRTRYFLQQSLTFADRTTHFLWGSLILAIFYVQEQRLVECVTVAETTARFALACGLNLPNQFRKEDNGSKGRESLLPLPKNKAETDERIRLAHSIYAGCQVLPFLCGSDPSFTYHDGWSQFWETSFSTDQDSKVLITEEEIWRSNLRLKVSFLDTFERVQKLRRAVSKYDDNSLDAEFMALETQILTQNTSFERRGPQLPESSVNFNPHTILSNATLYGSSLVLHSLRAGKDVESKRKLFECLQALVGICNKTQGNKRLHVGLLNAGHMMNAARIVAHELHLREVKQNAGLSVQYCQWIELLLDYLDDTAWSFPAWNEAYVTLRGTLATTVQSLLA